MYSYLSLYIIFDANMRIYIILSFRYVIDAADPNKFGTARKELHSILQSPSLNGIPLLLLFNKNDLPNARKAAEIVEVLELRKLKGREVAYYEISCKELMNIDITLDWLIKHSKK